MAPTDIGSIKAIKATAVMCPTAVIAIGCTSADMTAVAGFSKAVTAEESGKAVTAATVRQRSCDPEYILSHRVKQERLQKFITFYL